MAWGSAPLILLTILFLHCCCCSGDHQFYDGIKQTPSPTASIPSRIMLPQNTTTVLAHLAVTDPVINGTRTAYILETVTQQFQLVLQLQDVALTNESFCWIAVLDVINPSELAWRAPCQPVRTTSCSLRFTDHGDLQLLLPDSETVAWRTNTTDLGVRVLRILDYGNWLMLRARTDIVWQTSQYPAPQNCLIPGPIMVGTASDTSSARPPTHSGESSRPESLLAAVLLFNFIMIRLVL